jgi:hypothetical protein
VRTAAPAPRSGAPLLGAPLLAALVAAVLAAGPAAADGYRAIYDVRLAGAAPLSPVRSAEGRSAVLVAAGCGAASVRQETEIAWEVEGRGRVVATSTYAGEERDGVLGFAWSRTTDGAPEETRSGAADRAGGEIRWDAPRPRRADLPRGALFPSEMAGRLAAWAASGAPDAVFLLADGASYHGLREIRASRTGPADADGALPVRLAHFDVERSGLEAGHVVEGRLRTDGVFADYAVDLGAVRLGFSLRDLAPAAPCAE